jgi:DNA-binding NarL/FixJ family response regulator
MIRILLADDHPALRIGLRILLEQAPDIEVVGEASTGAEALTLILAMQPDVIVLDCQLPEMDGISVAREIKQRGLCTRILALSSYDDIEYVRGMVETGAVGYLLKNEAPSVIVSAVHATENEKWFSPSVAAHVVTLMEKEEQKKLANEPTEREQEVLELLAKGWTNGQIAKSLVITKRTVAYHVQNLLNKLDASNRTEAVVEAIRRGWLDV